MKLIDCKSCGSIELVEVAGYIVCVYCRVKYAPSASDLPPVESVIELKTDVDILLEKCAADPANRVRYVNLILDIDPSNSAVRKYL
jgi:hypothetical protein